MRGIGVAVITSRCGGRSALCGQHHPLGDPEAVLLVDDREAEPLVGDRLLEDGVGADEDVDRAVGEAHQGRFARPALLAPGEDGDVDRKAGELPRQRVEMLAGEDLGRRQQAPPGRPPRPRSSIAISATRVLPEPTSPWSRRSIGISCWRSPSISATARRWAPVGA